MSDLNTVSLQGRVVRNVDLETTKTGLTIARFAIATNRSTKSADGNRIDEVSYFPLTVFDKYASHLAPYLVKGQQIIVEGFVRQERWTQPDGKKRSATSIGVKQIHLVGRKPDSDNTTEVEIYDSEEIHEEFYDTGEEF